MKGTTYQTADNERGTRYIVVFPLCDHVPSLTRATITRFHLDRDLVLAKVTSCRVDSPTFPIRSLYAQLIRRDY
jgi:hypothetical protein